MDKSFETEVIMFYCHVCGSTEGKEKFVNEVFQIDDKPVLVEHIPAMVCKRGGEEIFRFLSCRSSGRI